MPISNIPISFYAGYKYTKRQVCIRHYARQHGYINGNPDPDLGERFVIYFNDKTDRGIIFERHAIESDAFEFKYKAI